MRTLAKVKGNMQSSRKRTVRTLTFRFKQEFRRNLNQLSFVENGEPSSISMLGIRRFDATIRIFLKIRRNRKAHSGKLNFKMAKGSDIRQDVKTFLIPSMAGASCFLRKTKRPLSGSKKASFKLHSSSRFTSAPRSPMSKIVRKVCEEDG